MGDFFKFINLASMPAKVITLATDFGHSDHYAGTMKGVILGIYPQATIVDITHEIAPFAIEEGAYTIGEAWRYFPQGTIHVVVVDPGVGSERRPVLCESSGQYFIAPDNGVLTMVYAAGPCAVRVITNENLFLPLVSRTFHGRDIFAPCAAHLAKGVPVAEFGAVIDDYARSRVATPRQTARHNWTGCVLKADRFGNLITNFRLEDFPDMATRNFDLAIGLEKVGRLAKNYAQCEVGEIVALVGSGGYLEVSMNQGSAAKSLGCGSGSPVELIIY
jgi:S-adenosyl-L-methionine hydrolase (adenosine-forming)